jgi:hypothetical protein
MGAGALLFAGRVKIARPGMRIGLAVAPPSAGNASVHPRALGPGSACFALVMLSFRNSPKANIRNPGLRAAKNSRTASWPSASIGAGGSKHTGACPHGAAAPRSHTSEPRKARVHAVRSGWRGGGPPMHDGSALGQGHIRIRPHPAQDDLGELHPEEQRR